MFNLTLSIFSTRHSSSPLELYNRQSSLLFNRSSSHFHNSMQLMEPSGSEASEAQSKDKGNVPVIDVDSENVNQSVDERVSDHVDEQKKRRYKSFVWDHFPRIEGATEAKCPYCGTVLAANSKQNGTSTLEWGITRVFTVTVDNASSNDGAIKKLRTLLKGPNAILDCKYLHLRCCAHIINLVVRDGLEEQNSSICKIRRAVKYLRSSSGRQESFENGVEFEKVDCKRKPCLDVDTRWNSTFLMLETAVKFEKVFDSGEYVCGWLELTEHDYTSYFFNEPEDGEEGTRMMPKTKKKKKNVVGVPNEDDWSNARFFLEYLRIFYDVTNKISGCKYVTSNMFVKDLVTMHAAISKMCRHADENKRKIALSMKAKYDKYWDNLDNMNVLFRTETSNQGDQVSKRLKTLSAKTIEICKIVEDALKELYVHYKIKLDKHNDETFTLSSSSTPSEDDCSMKIDLDMDFQSWWNQNMMKFPILSQVAKHVLAMPISTVASESAFSTGGRVIDKYRSSLTPKTAEALICAQDWLRSTPADLQDMPINGLPLEEMVENLEKLELEHIHSLVDLEHKREAPVVENPELVGVFNVMEVLSIKFEVKPTDGEGWKSMALCEKGARDSLCKQGNSSFKTIDRRVKVAEKEIRLKNLFPPDGGAEKNGL
ncbi:zinc finger BED domain-containing protein RICESLEEPER 2-like protein [Tanacetum coccineum]